MSCRGRLVWDRGFLDYDFGNHPLNPVRLEFTIALATELGVLDAVDIVAPRPATREELLVAHDADYLDAVRTASADPTFSGYGLGTDDDPVFAGMYEASALVAGGSLIAADAVTSGAAEHALNIAGGLHHAMRGYASGFCVFNDAVLGIRRLLAGGAQRVAYVDIDVHHGDGVQAAFYDDPRVLTISLHQDPRTLFPGTGLPTELGRGPAVGTSINVALPPGTDDGGWLRAFHAVVPGAVRAFAPDVLVTQCGCDTHHEDPLANLELTVDGQRAAIAGLARAGSRGDRRPLARVRRRRLRAGALRASHLDAPDRRDQRPARRSADGGSGVLDHHGAPAPAGTPAASGWAKSPTGRSRRPSRGCPAATRGWTGRSPPAGRPRSRCSASIPTTLGTDPMPYPAHWEADVVAADGGIVHLRPITPEDADAIVAFHDGLSTRTRYLRYFSAHPRLTDKELYGFTHVDHHDRVALVAVLGEQIIAVGRYEREPGTDGGRGRVRGGRRPSGPRHRLGAAGAPRRRRAGERADRASSPSCSWRTRP